VRVGFFPLEGPDAGALSWLIAS